MRLIAFRLFVVCRAQHGTLQKMCGLGWLMSNPVLAHKVDFTGDAYKTCLL